MDNKKTALIVFGGKSFEHDISIITTLIVLRNVKNCKYNFLPLYLNKDNEWFLFLGKKLSIEYFKNFDNEYKQNGFVKAFMKTNENGIFFKKGLTNKKINIDVVLNTCHGGVGEDGSLVSLFETLNIPISSGGAIGMGVCMDKVLSKLVFDGCKLPIIKYFSFTKHEYEIQKEKVLEKAEDLGYPLILKPSTLGSSIGIEVAKTKDEFINSCKVALEFDDEILVEKALLDDTKEYNIACMRVGDEVLVSKIDVVKKTEEILSFNDKYIGSNNSKTQNLKMDFGKNERGEKFKLSGQFNSQRIKSEEEINPKIYEKIKKYSKDIYEKLKLSGVVRIDYILDKKDKIFINEINSVPGSLAYYFFVPSIFKTFSDFIDNILDDVINKMEKKRKIKKEYITQLI